jgi:hypothetical protein
VRLAVAIVVVAIAFSASADVAITVYNSGIALVKDTRLLPVPSGEGEVTFSDVAALLDPTSVRVEAVDHPARLEFLEQNFDYDLASQYRLLERFLGRELVVTTGSGSVSGVLLSYLGGLTLSRDGGICVVGPGEVTGIVFPELPGGLRSKPTLRWLVDSRSGGRERCRVSYLTHGVGWHAEYVAVVSPVANTMSFSGWVSIENESGASYTDAKLKVVAGDIHRVTTGTLERTIDAVMPAATASEKRFEEEAFFEYHLYDLQRPTTLADRQIKQIALFSDLATTVRRVYTFDPWYAQSKVGVSLVFENREGRGPGIPLPEGRVRVMQEASDGSLERVGEDRIDHTPQGEEVRLRMPDAFDMLARRTVISARRVGRANETDVVVRVANRSNEDRTVVVVEHPGRFAEIKKPSHTVRMPDADTAEFDVYVPSDSVAELTYTIREIVR